MHGAAVTLANQVDPTQPPDLILATDMLDLATFKGLLSPALKGIPTAAYFHENQLTYPFSERDTDKKQKRDNHYAFLNFTTALAADAVFFNSAYHQQAFLDALPPFLKQFPDFRNLERVQEIADKSTVLSLGLDLQRLDAFAEESENQKPLILWNHRWEFDKGPEAFFDLLKALIDRNLDFEVAILGEQFRESPAVFNNAADLLGDRLLTCGYAESAQAYADWLWRADLIPITSNQDFFGGSLIEAMYCNCFPLVPNRLAFPGHFPAEQRLKHVYSSFNDLVDRCTVLLQDTEQLQVHNARALATQYDWGTLQELYHDALAKVLAYSKR